MDICNDIFSNSNINIINKKDKDSTQFIFGVHLRTTIN